MEGKRTQGVIHKYLMEAADEIQTKGVQLSERLYGRSPSTRRARPKLPSADAASSRCCSPRKTMFSSRQIERVYETLFEARDADTKTKLRMLTCALIYAKHEHIYQIDRASFVLATENWIPIEGSTSWISSKPCQHSPRGVASALPRYRAAVRSGTLPPSVRRNAAASRIAASAASKRARISNS